MRRNIGLRNYTNEYPKELNCHIKVVNKHIEHKLKIEHVKDLFLQSVHAIYNIRSQWLFYRITNEHLSILNLHIRMFRSHNCISIKSTCISFELCNNLNIDIVRIFCNLLTWLPPLALAGIGRSDELAFLSLFWLSRIIRAAANAIFALWRSGDYFTRNQNLTLVASSLPK